MVSTMVSKTTSLSSNLSTGAKIIFDNCQMNKYSSNNAVVTQLVE